jgi:hypothetical protein
MKEATRPSETSALTRVTRRHIFEGGILHSHRRKNLKTCIALTGWDLWLRRNVSPVRYGLASYIPEDGIPLGTACFLLHKNRMFKYYLDELEVFALNLAAFPQLCSLLWSMKTVEIKGHGLL